MTDALGSTFDAYRHSVSCVPSQTTAEVRLDDRQYVVIRLTTGSRRGGSASAIQNHASLLQKAVSGANLSLAEASIWRISVLCFWRGENALLGHGSDNLASYGWVCGRHEVAHEDG